MSTGTFDGRKALTNGTYWGPVYDDPSFVELERTFMQAGYMTGLAFGIQLVLYLMCMAALWKRKPRTGFTWFLMIYISILNAMNTIWTGTSTMGLQITFIDYRNFPMGPIGVLSVEFSLPVNILALAALVAGNLLADGLLLWRCYVIWTAALGTKALIAMIVPGLMLCGSLVMSVIFSLYTVNPSLGLFDRKTINFATLYFGISLGLNLLLTIMIVFRLWRQKVKGREIFGDNYGQHYTSISTMFVESAALYAIISILLLVTNAIAHPVYQIWFGLAPGIQMASSYLIIYRVVQGRAWTTQTLATTKAGTGNTTFRFQNSSYGHSDTRVGRTNQDTFQLTTLDDKDAQNTKISGIQVMKSTEVASDKSWTAKEEA